MDDGDALEDVEKWHGSISRIDNRRLIVQHNP
ncbi:MAG: hypothetical protein ACI8P0_002855 [Planctomycetaceae bacterium]|jgi:hypothetical protein